MPFSSWNRKCKTLFCLFSPGNRSLASKNMISQHYYQCSLGKRSAQGFLLGFHGLENVKEFARGAVGALPRKIPRRSLLSKSCSKYGEEQHARASQHVPQSEIVFKGAARAKMIQNHTTRYLTSDHSIEPCAVKLCCSERPESTGDKATETVKWVHNNYICFDQTGRIRDNGIK